MSAGPRTAVGSSRIRMSEPRWSWRSSSKRLRSATPTSPAGRSHGSFQPDVASSADVAVAIAATSSAPPPGRLDAEDEVLGQREVVDDRELLVDHADAERTGSLDRADPVGRRPSNRMLPSSGFVSPATHRINVVLPAPFSPTMAWTVPAVTAHRHRVAGRHGPERLGQPDDLEARRSGGTGVQCVPGPRHSGPRSQAAPARTAFAQAGLAPRRSHQRTTPS